MVDLDWDLLGDGDEKTEKSEFLVQAQSQPRIDEPSSFGAYNNHHHEFNDSDGMAPDPRYSRQKHPGGPEFPYINFESDNERYHDFSGDEEDTHLHFESHGTIQDAIKRQQRCEEEHHTVVGGQKVSSSGDMNSNAMIMRPPTGTVPRPQLPYMAQMRTAPIRNISSMPLMEASQQGKGVSFQSQRQIIQKQLLLFCRWSKTVGETSTGATSSSRPVWANVGRANE